MPDRMKNVTVWVAVLALPSFWSGMPVRGHKCSLTHLPQVVCPFRT